jgi:hypothetical protein
VPIQFPLPLPISAYLWVQQLICACNLNPGVHQPFVFKITFNKFHSVRLCFRFVVPGDKVALSFMAPSWIEEDTSIGRLSE